MVVNYDLPLLNDQATDGIPDIDTYRHRIGTYLHVSVTTQLTFLSGRTGRFGRKGISINFVHDKKTWLQMEQIEKELGRKIMRIETNDLDEMEEVGFFYFPF